MGDAINKGDAPAIITCGHCGHRATTRARGFPALSAAQLAGKTLACISCGTRQRPRSRAGDRGGLPRARAAHRGVRNPAPSPPRNARRPEARCIKMKARSGDPGPRKATWCHTLQRFDGCEIPQTLPVATATRAVSTTRTQAQAGAPAVPDPRDTAAAAGRAGPLGGVPRRARRATWQAPRLPRAARRDMPVPVRPKTVATCSTSAGSNPKTS